MQSILACSPKLWRLLHWSKHQRNYMLVAIMWRRDRDRITREEPTEVHAQLTGHGESSLGADTDFSVGWLEEWCHFPKLLFSLLLLLFLFFPFIFISWRLIPLQYCSGFCHTLTWISHGFTCIPHPNPPSHLPLLPIPLGLPSAPAPSTCLMHPTWAGDLFHPWKYTFRCCSLETSHPRLLPQSPKVCSVHLCLFFCFAYSVVVTIFLNSIYMH